MSLSIYSIKHPLLLNWTSSIHHSNVSSRHKYQFLKIIGLALIYEATRKSTHAINLSINSINKYKNVSILPQQLSYLILIDISFYQVLGHEIDAILPSSILCPMYSINSCTKNTKLKNNQLLKEILAKSDSKSLIILIKYLNDRYIYKILNTFQSNNCIFSKIQICCITCSAEALQLLNTQKYNFDIYTTKILDYA